jgi:hypothetical protein
MTWARMLAYITGTVDQKLLLRNEYRREHQEVGGLAWVSHLLVAWRDENTNILQAIDSTSSTA